MSAPIDRRSFLSAAAGAAVGLAASGCAAGAPGASGALASGAAASRRRPRVARVGSRTLQQAIRGHVFYRGQPGFATVYPVYNQRFDGVMPSAVARPVDAGDVQNAVRWLLSNNVPLRARSGGHSYAGYSTLSNGVVLDLRRLNGINVNHHAGTATIGPGAQLIDVYAGLASHGATIPGGSCPSVGIAGVTLGGGMGLAGRKFGLSTDNLLAAQIVTADGKLRFVGPRTDPDLLWALRGGGGGNFGIVTAFVFKVHPLPSSASFFNVSWPWSSASEAIDAWQHWAPYAPDEITSILHVTGGGSPSINANGQYLGPSSNLPGLLAQLTSVSGAYLHPTFERGYLDMQFFLTNCSINDPAACHTVNTSPGGTLPRESFNAKSDYVSHPLSSAGRQALISAIEAPGSDVILCDAYGGAINRVAPDATAFVHRRQLFCMQYLTYNGNFGWLGSAHAAMRPYVSGQAYQNYIDSALPHWQQEYYGKNYSRLLATRQRIDPHHGFNFPQAIGH